MSKPVIFLKTTSDHLTAFSIAVAVAVSGSPAQANDSAAALALMHTTGVAPHLADASSVIAEDAWPGFTQCLDAADSGFDAEEQADFVARVESHFGTDIVIQRAVRSLAGAMSTQDLARVDVFFQSPTGQRIIAAEQGSKDLDEHRFTQFMEHHFQSGAWNEARYKLIEAVFDATRSDRFVSTLNGELLAAISVSSRCAEPASGPVNEQNVAESRREADTKTGAGSDGLAELQTQLDLFRSEARFIEPLMRGELLRLVATVFRNLPDSDLQGYAEFAQSELGERFFDALVSATQTSLSEGVADLVQSLGR